MSYTIRLFEPRDAHAIAGITLDAIRAVGTHRYSAEQVRVWAARHPGPQRFLERHKAGATILVAVGQADTPVAYTLLEDAPDAGGHLDMLYCHPDHTRKGLAERLLAAAEHHARGSSMTHLFTEASELARPAFSRAGYIELHRRDFTVDGVAIHNYAMEKRLR